MWSVAQLEPQSGRRVLSAGEKLPDRGDGDVRLRLLASASRNAANACLLLGLVGSRSTASAWLIVSLNRATAAGSTLAGVGVGAFADDGATLADARATRLADARRMDRFRQVPQQAKRRENQHHPAGQQEHAEPGERTGRRERHKTEKVPSARAGGQTCYLTGPRGQGVGQQADGGVRATGP